MCIEKSGVVVLFKSEFCGMVVGGEGIGTYAIEWRRLTPNEKITLSNVN